MKLPDGLQLRKGAQALVGGNRLKTQLGQSGEIGEPLLDRESEIEPAAAHGGAYLEGADR